jgi:hypothetical protein
MKHFGKLLIIALIIISNSAFTFANEAEIKYDIDDYLEIINPSFDKVNDLEIKKNLFISMNIKQDANLYLTIKKIVPVIDELYFDKIINEEIDRDEFVSNIADRVIEINTSTENDVIAEIESSDEKEKIIVIIDKYIEEYINKKELESEFIIVTKEVDLFSSDLIENQEIGTEENVIVEKYNKAKEDYINELEIFNESKNQYNELFKVKILDRDLIASVGVMPYYEKTIEDLFSGKYEMIIELDNEKIYTLKEIQFNVKVKQDEEILVESELELIEPSTDVNMILIQPSIESNMKLVQPPIGNYELEE